MMTGFEGRRVLVRTKHDLFEACVTGAWWDDKSECGGPVVTTDGGRSIEIDTKRIVMFADTQEILWRSE